MIDEALANGIAFFLAIGLPLIIIFAFTSHRRTLRHREKKLELEAQIEIARAQQRGGRDDRLEQRVRVLERIVTEKGLPLADEIERLRDDRVT